MKLLVQMRSIFLLFCLQESSLNELCHVELLDQVQGEALKRTFSFPRWEGGRGMGLSHVITL